MHLFVLDRKYYSVKDFFCSIGNFEEVSYRTKHSGGWALFNGIPETVKVACYHSLAADADTIPEELEITAVATDGEVMAVQHKRYPIYGVRFHPESIVAPDGKQMLNNFIKEI